MAAEQEVEYFSLSTGNGLTPVERTASIAKKAGAKKAGASANKGTSQQTAKGGFRSFLQGVTVGSVLLIPVGVWCWVQMDVKPVTQADEAAAASPATRNAIKSAVKSAFAANPRKKTARSLALASPAKTPTGKPLPTVAIDAPPHIAPTIPVAPLVTAQIPKVAGEEDLATDPPKKGLWHRLTSPFRSKEKTAAKQADSQ